MSELKNGKYITKWGATHYYKDGKLHREDDLPAVEWNDGKIEW